MGDFLKFTILVLPLKKIKKLKDNSYHVVILGCF
jgi:hypothetical protein